MGWEKEEVITGYHRPKIGESSYNEKNFKEFKIELMEKFKKSANVVNAYLSILKPIEKEVIQKRLGLIDGKRHTLEEIGNEKGLTRERIRQIEKRGFKRILSLENDLREGVDN